MDNFKDITVRDAYIALKENGFEHIRDEWFREDIEGVITGGCVIAQTALNLGVSAQGDNSLQEALNNFSVLITSKYYVNSFSRLGDTIITWNDKTRYDEKLERFVYVLPTYSDVAKMAYSLMKPHFKAVLHDLRTRNWTFKKLDGTIVEAGVVVES